MSFFYKDCRIRNSARSTPVPLAYRAYIFQYSEMMLGATNERFKVILSHSFPAAVQRIKEFCCEQGLEYSAFRYRGDDDFEVIAVQNILR